MKITSLKDRAKQYKLTDNQETLIYQRFPNTITIIVRKYYEKCCVMPYFLYASIIVVELSTQVTG